MHSVTVKGQRVYPSKIVCVGRNYVEHIKELGNEVPDHMVVFNKPNSALTNTLHARLGEPLHYEGELAFAIENGTIAAVGFGLDLTKRGLQSSLKKKGLPWERAKAFDGAALLGAFVALPPVIETLSLRLTVDGATRQAGGVDLMMYKPATIVTELRQFMSLEDGDIIMTGTPAGVGVVQAGECFVGQVLADQEILVEANWTAV
ncbi:MAG: fumarylacetoacetate hydrolase family protein [Halieaceae bacterium]|jgi:2-keto-4-pentenoate hydratase/2-oxohepta-3-ene-1,7-dioic acid hydratase in catechol pathway|nr:fumarylacetoacetate hydrolase family protein [Halieaceae bacterium]